MTLPKQPNQFIKYSNLFIQMAVIIGFSAWGGKKLDTHFKNNTPVFTIIFSLLGIATALYTILKDFIGKKK